MHFIWSILSLCILGEALSINALRACVTRSPPFSCDTKNGRRRLQGAQSINTERATSTIIRRSGGKERWIFTEPHPCLFTDNEYSEYKPVNKRISQSCAERTSAAPKRGLASLAD